MKRADHSQQAGHGLELHTGPTRPAHSTTALQAPWRLHPCRQPQWPARQAPRTKPCVCRTCRLLFWAASRRRWTSATGEVRPDIRGVLALRHPCRRRRARRPAAPALVLQGAPGSHPPGPAGGLRGVVSQRYFHAAGHLPPHCCPHCLVLFNDGVQQSMGQEEGRGLAVRFLQEEDRRKTRACCAVSEVRALPAFRFALRCHCGGR